MMGFEPGWCGRLARTSAIKCFGNAVVPQVAQVIGGHVAAKLGMQGADTTVSALPVAVEALADESGM